MCEPIFSINNSTYQSLCFVSTLMQVSNWFINARVRLWKPMVEEIHMLESKGVAEMDLNSSNRNDGKSIMDGGARHPHSDQVSQAESNKPLDCSCSMDPVVHESSSNIGMEQWHCEKRSRMGECSTVPGSIDDGLMSFAYQGGMDFGGLGAVSLTLGLRHNEDPQQQQQQQMRHFGGQMLHDFVGWLIASSIFIGVTIVRKGWSKYRWYIN